MILLIPIYKIEIWVINYYVNPSNKAVVSADAKYHCNNPYNVKYSKSLLPRLFAGWWLSDSKKILKAGTKSYINDDNHARKEFCKFLSLDYQIITNLIKTHQADNVKYVKEIVNNLK